MKIYQALTYFSDIDKDEWDEISENDFNHLKINGQKDIRVLYSHCELEKAQLAVGQANQAVLAASETIQKLAAENEALKNYLEPIGLSIEGTPATDAAIAEIKAQGVDEFAAHKREIAAGYKRNGCEESWVDDAEDCALGADLFADNLRAGRKG